MASGTLSDQGQLRRTGRPAAIILSALTGGSVAGRTVLRARATERSNDARDAPSELLAERRRRVGARVELAIAGHELRVVVLEPREELLADAGPQVKEDRRDAGGARIERRRDHLAELTRVIRDAGQDRCDQDAARDARGVQRGDGLDPLAGVRRSGLAPPPRVVVERADRERGGDPCDASRVEQPIDVAQDQRALREDREGVAVV